MDQRILILIPAYNEAENIGHVIDDIYSCNVYGDVLVIDDGSSDGTARSVMKKGASVVRHVDNLGIGASFETGCQFALKYQYDYIVRMDADGQHRASYVEALLQPLQKGEADVVIGSRFIGESAFTSSFIRLIGIRILVYLLSVMIRQKITDPTSGFCAMNKKAFSYFAYNCAEDYPEPEIIIHHKNFRIREVPISIQKRITGLSTITPIKSLFYIIKVILLFTIHIFRKELR